MFQGGFSYVYLVQDNSNQQLLALKKIRCPFGQESVSLALKEVEAYTLFSPHPNIIHSIDYSVESDKSDASAKTVYILLPYYRRGNLQDMINANLVNHTKFPERRLMVLFLGVCKALKAMHQYKVKSGPGGARSENNAKKVRREAARADAEAAESMEMRPSRKHREHDDDDEQEAEGLLEETEASMATQGIAPGGERAYAHRDIKPGMFLATSKSFWCKTNRTIGNIMIDDDGNSPILMDLGSLAPSPTPITSRSLALQIQDLAAEHCTMPYRAPELFDVKTGSVIDTKVDIWSLGCTLYACLVGKSPFEFRSDETGGSLSICVLGGDWRFPDEGPQRGKAKQTEEVISEGVKEVVRKCLRLEPSERPDVDELIGIVEELLQGLPEDGSED
jgi:serine/threonine kinase 16